MNSEVNILDQIAVEPGAIYIFDRGYVDFARLHMVHQAAGFFIIKTRNNVRFTKLYSRNVNKSIEVQCDQTIIPTNFYARKDYPSKLRSIRYFHSEANKRLVFLTNIFTSQQRPSPIFTNPDGRSSCSSNGSSSI